MLTEKEFAVLTTLEAAKRPLSQRAVAAGAKISLGNANQTVSALTERGLIADGAITEAGLAALEPYRVRRAVFLAAGFGSRLVPITLNTPKPLVRVKGKRIIDSLLDAMIAVGIEEIYIVRGYLADQFTQLLPKYPNIVFIDNPLYMEANNISSALAARHFLENAYVCEADLLLYNPALVTKYQYRSNYLGIPVERTDDWCLQTKKGIVTKIGIGGINCHQIVGISYWNKEDGERLGRQLEEDFNAPGGKERFWDQVPLENHIADYRVGVRDCRFEDICEIDTFSELQKLDETYRIN
ncbi:MAG: NTP transferase domain-containing protein [Clostridia bacterium]|nr:NTP transferase domain-containing protein [Clostridia bacterium]